MGSEKSSDLRAIKVSRWMLDQVLFYNNLFLFTSQVYQPWSSLKTCSNGLEAIRYPLEEMSSQEELDNRNKQSHRCYKFISIFVIYFFAKTSAINALHLILHNLDQTDNSCYSWWPNCRETLWIMRNTLGDSLSELGGGSVFFTWGSVCFVYIFVVFMPYYFRSHTLDVASLRFYYEPQREIDRIDDIIDCRLNEMLESILNYNGMQNKMLYRDCDYELQQLILSNRMSVERIHQQLVGLRSEGNISLRPDYFVETNRLRALRETSWTLIVWYLYNASWSMALVVPMVIIAAKAKCDAMRLMQCSLSTAFSFQEDIQLTELVISMVLGIAVYTFHTTCMFVQLRSHKKLVANMRADLGSCLSNLRAYNISRSSAEDAPEVEHKRVLPVEKALFENFVRIRVEIDELRRGVAGITQLLNPWFVMTMIQVVLSLLVDGMRSRASRSFKIQILVSYWILLNTLALVCAGVVSEFIQLQHLYWSIQAELIVYHNGIVTNNSFISLVWQRLSSYTRSISHLLTAKPLNIALTYPRIIEINFSIIAVVSFLSRSLVRV